MTKQYSYFLAETVF